jgi:hypothetical protein
MVEHRSDRGIVLDDEDHRGRGGSSLLLWRYHNQASILLSSPVRDERSPTEGITYGYKTTACRLRKGKS